MTTNDNTTRHDWTVTGMDCAACATKITSALERLPGVADVQVGVMSERLSLRLAPGATGRDAVEAAVRRLGYGIAPKGEPTGKRTFVIPTAVVRDHEGHDHAGHDHAKHDLEGHDHAKAAADDASLHGGPGHSHASPAQDMNKHWYQTAKG
ncbi:MAG: cation transporter, partial [Cypionkella sp.]